jgi:hypothetical protein
MVTAWINFKILSQLQDDTPLHPRASLFTTSYAHIIRTIVYIYVLLLYSLHLITRRFLRIGIPALGERIVPFGGYKTMLRGTHCLCPQDIYFSTIRKRFQIKANILIFTGARTLHLIT